MLGAGLLNTKLEVKVLHRLLLQTRAVPSTRLWLPTLLDRAVKTGVWRVSFFLPGIL